MRRASLSLRLTGFAVGLVLLSLSVSTLIVYQQMRGALERSLGEQLLTVVRSTATFLNGDLHGVVRRSEAGSPEPQEEFELLRTVLSRVKLANALHGHAGASPLYTLRPSSGFLATGALEFVVMTDPDPATGRFFTGNRYPSESFQRLALGGVAAATGVYADAEGDWISAAAPIRNGDGQVVGIVQADRPVTEFRAMVWEQAVGLVLGALAVLAFAAAIAARVARGIVQPVRRLVAASRRLGEGDLSQRVSVMGAPPPDDELGTLSVVFNGMAEALERSRVEIEAQISLKSRFITQASHEFRTPLAVIQAAVDSVDRYGTRMTAEERGARFERVRLQVQHMTAMIDDVLLLDRRDGVSESNRAEPLDISLACQEILAEIRGVSTRQHELQLICPPAVGRVLLDRRLLSQVLSNLLLNAIKFSPAGGAVVLQVVPADGELIFTVRDHGIGVPSGDRGLYFQPFHRAANVGALPGAGLGLAVAHRAVEVMGGQIEIDSPSDGGTIVTVRVPAPPVASTAVARAVSGGRG